MTVSDHSVDGPSHLLLMRHAKSSWDDDSLSDHQRPLNKRGRRAADAVARALVACGTAPDIIWCSDAARTLETAERMIRIIPGAQTIIRTPKFYHASAAQMMQLCNDSPAPTGRLMLLGHNPGVSTMFSDMTGQDHNYPTGCCAVFKHASIKPAQSAADGPWLAPDMWRFIDMILPREIMADTDPDEVATP